MVPIGLAWGKLEGDGAVNGKKYNPPQSNLLQSS